MSFLIAAVCKRTEALTFLDEAMIFKEFEVQHTVKEPKVQEAKVVKKIVTTEKKKPIANVGSNKKISDFFSKNQS